MANNYIQPGERITITAPSAVSSGDFVQVGEFGGVALTDAESGANVALGTCGVWQLPSTDGTLTVGTPAFWDGSAVTATSTDNLRIGHAVADQAGGTVRVRLSL